MHAAIVTDFGQPPKYTTVPDPAPSTPDTLRLKVLAAGVHNVVRAIAAGRHFLKSTPPFAPGIDGVGVDEGTGQKYYFSTLAAGDQQHGSLAEYVTVPSRAAAPLPDGADPLGVAALMNPSQSSWMALRRRTGDVLSRGSGWSVIIMGVTSASGRIAVQVARSLGATRIVGASRAGDGVAAVEGLDGAIVLAEDPTKTDFSSLGQVDIILDYVYGTGAVPLLESLPPSEREVQYVEIGTLSKENDMPLPASLLRSKQVALRGAGPGAWTARDLAGETEGLLNAVKKLKAGNMHVARLGDVENVWDSADVRGKRLVFVP